MAGYVNVEPPSYPDEISFLNLQSEVSVWSFKNFGAQPAYFSLLGAVEEIGELCHAHLKREQGIRGTAEEHVAAEKDAIGDAVIYLTDYCSRRGYDLGMIVTETWSRVRRRDWKKDPVLGGSIK